VQGRTIPDSDEIAVMSPLRAMKLISLYAHDTWTSHVDDWVGAGFWCLFAVLLLSSLRRRARPIAPASERIPAAPPTESLEAHRSEDRSLPAESAATGAHPGALVPFVVTLLVYLATPFRVGTGVFLNLRMAPILGLFALLGLRPPRGPRGSIPIALSAVLAVAQCFENVQQITRLRTDVSGLPELLRALPKGSRLITLNFSGYDPNAAHFTPWLHVGSWHRASNGGVASFSFSELPHWSVQYKPPMAPPQQDALSWGMRPCLYRNHRDGPYFDYVLARGALDPFANDPPGPRWTVMGKTEKYTLYAKDRTVAPIPFDGVTDDGPCATP
jgi:hypothetical protein